MNSTTAHTIVRKIVVNNGCWEWQGYLRSDGYSKMYRRSYEVFIGPIPSGFEIDHVCMNRSCVNPDHLEAITPKENVRRCIAYGGRRLSNYCGNGHEYTTENTRFSRGYRNCRTCARERARRRYRPAATREASS